MEQTLYRKYRPGQFSELAGQDHIKRLFSKSLIDNSYSHAYIFAGPRGTGKTTVARIIAKRLNCLHPKGNEPCNECDQCVAINEGSHIDVIEMDAASNRGIDDFRAIRDRVAYKPAQGKVKVYIIDEVHMLTNEAFNAILKTLEEPPDHAVFILATTNPEKIPETIISRCQIIPFRNMTVNTMINHLQMIAQKEGYTVEGDVFSYIAKRAKGSMRDAIVLLEQILRFLPKDEAIQKKDILQVLGGVDEEQYHQLITMIQRNQTQNIIDFTEDLYNSGINFEVFLDGLIDYILSHMTQTNDLSLQKLNLGIAKKSSEMIKEIKYSDNPNIIFAIEFLSFAETNTLYKDIEKTQKTEEVKQVTKTQQIQETLVPDPLEEKETLHTKQITTDLKAPTLNSELLKDIKSSDIDLYVALLCLKCEETSEGIVKIFKNNKCPFSNDVVEQKEKTMRDYFNKYSKKIEIVEDKQEPLRQIKQENEEVQQEKIPQEVRGIYDKLKKLFPESDIVIKDNQA
ncbi:MAG: DNA polymerase III subunit gamma/tau [Thermotogota bacterium]|nr:DNA polymerase III subunit gamma/tau [Thermotogota bacterium]